MRIKASLSFLFVFIGLLCSCGFAQNMISEYSGFECSHSKLITIPFTTNNNSGENKTPITVKQTVFYEHRDQFSYWYKVLINTDGIITCKISPINEKDSYVVYIYKYNKDDFCNKVFYGKIEPLKKSKFLNSNENKEGFEMTEIQIKTKKDEAYYFCVLNVSPSNCGHYMQLNAGIDTFHVKAIHLPCSEDDVIAKPISTVTSTTIDSSKKTYQIVTINVLEENNKTKKVDARLKIKDELTGNEVEFKTTKGSSYTMQIEKGRQDRKSVV